MASANVSEPLRWKRAKTHRGSRRRDIEPHQEAGYTSAVVTIDPDPAGLLQSGGVHIRPHMALVVDLAELALLPQLGDQPTCIGLANPARMTHKRPRKVYAQYDPECPQCCHSDSRAR